MARLQPAVVRVTGRAQHLVVLVIPAGGFEPAQVTGELLELCQLIMVAEAKELPEQPHPGPQLLGVLGGWLMSPLLQSLFGFAPF
ncbi:hypothetical protein FRC11_014390 [Ceratobasidium sp. 423]|nr:hypothetical protein FRC11_014390 [Ceratobasidium sp. 423]